MGNYTKLSKWLGLINRITAITLSMYVLLNIILLESTQDIWNIFHPARYAYDFVCVCMPLIISSVFLTDKALKSLGVWGTMICICTIIVFLPIYALKYVITLHIEYLMYLIAFCFAMVELCVKCYKFYGVKINKVRRKRYMAQVFNAISILGVVVALIFNNLNEYVIPMLIPLVSLLLINNVRSIRRVFGEKRRLLVIVIMALYLFAGFTVIFNLFCLTGFVYNLIDVNGFYDFEYIENILVPVMTIMTMISAFLIPKSADRYYLIKAKHKNEAMDGIITFITLSVPIGLIIYWIFDFNWPIRF